MGHATPDFSHHDLAFVCDEPTCELSRGPLGLTASEIQARVLGLRARPPEPADPTDPDDADELDEGGEDELDEPDDDPADLTAIDPLGEGAPCPLCRAARPPRTGKLLAIPHRGAYARVLAATAGFFGLNYWQLIESDSTTGTNRHIDAQRRALGETTTSKATTSFVVGRKLITAVVLKELPFDGHLLRLGNRDADVFEFIEVEARGKKKRRKKGWAKGTAQYGIDQSPPSADARANPIYIRELQEDLIWLGYLSTTRGSPTPGKFDVYTLGAVLGFKQDLAEIYGVATSAKRLSVTPGSVRAGEFSTAIWYQAAFVSPVRIILDWRTVLCSSKKRKGAASVVQALARGVKNNLARAKNVKSFRSYLAALQQRRATLDALMASWPHVLALETVDRPFTPFSPKESTKTVAELAAAPAGKRPKHADRAALAGDPIWSSEEYNAREKNRQFFLADVREVLSAIDDTLDDIAETQARMTELAAPAEAVAEWTTARPVVDATLAQLAKLLALVEFWVLDSPTQMKAWLDHIADMGTVDQPTAVYLKALREGGKIGPGKRPAYQLRPLTGADDFATADDGARHLRDECTGRPDNQNGKKCETMPEIVALQFFGNESGLKFTHSLAPFNTRAEDKATRLVLMGIDTNAHRKGSFDAVFHAGGDWYWSRGWGVGQATEADGTLDGVQLRRGLPILPSGADVVQHPRAFADRKESVADAMERKILAKYNGRTARRDCTFETSGAGRYYDCHTCLQRFFDSKLIGTGEYGKGGVFVPVGKGVIGSPDRAARFFVDFERYTPFARAGGAVEDPVGTNRYRTFFGQDLAEASADVVAVLRRMDGKITISGAIKAVAKEVKAARGVDIDQAALAAEVDAHVAARSELPCSWLLVRMLYAGSGEQAFASLGDLLRVVGDLDSNNETLLKHIKEASELRRNA
jgi:hypothetical protein